MLSLPAYLLQQLQKNVSAQLLVMPAHMSHHMIASPLPPKNLLLPKGTDNALWVCLKGLCPIKDMWRPAA